MIRTVETIISKFCFIIQEGGDMVSMAQIQVGWALRDIIKTIKTTETKLKFDKIQYAQSTRSVACYSWTHHLGGWPQEWRQ
jgi:hypothetical protein